MTLPRPRRRSVGLVCGSFLVFAVGTNVQAGWLFVLASLLMAVAIAGWLLPARMVKGVEVQRQAPPYAFQGDEVPVDVVVTGGARHAPLSLSIVDPYVAPARMFIRRLDRAERLVLTTHRKAVRRGPIEGAALELASSGPFGVATARRSVPAGGRTLVYPRVIPLSWFPGVDGDSEEGLPATSTHRRGAGQDYLGIREYRPGDSPRHVHWPSSARLGALMVREFEQERPQRVAILIDTSADRGTQETPLDACCSAAASVALFVLGRGQPVDLCAAQEGTLRVLEEPGPAEALEWLTHLRRDGGMPLAEASRQTAALLGPDRVGVLAFPTWAWNDLREAAAASDALGSEGRRPVAVVVEAGSFQDTIQGRGPKARRLDPSPPVLPTGTVDQLVRALRAGGSAVLHVTASRDLGECLAQLAEAGA
jgi:uncharacterized protein (DUF58 family)